MELKNIKKYEKKNIKNYKGGFHKIISVDNTDFLNGYTQIQNSGQKNCGIYINVLEKKIIKCENINEEKLDLLDKIYTEYPNFNIFPEIYNIYSYNGNHYTEMFKFDDDVSGLLYKILSLECLDKMIELGEIHPDDKIYYHNIFMAIIKKTIRNYDSSNPDINFIEFPNGLQYFYENREKLNNFNEEVNKVEISNREKPYKKQIINITFAGFTIPIYEKFDAYIENIDNIVKLFAHPNISNTIYQKFIKIFMLNIKINIL
jgi:hypothetical protein